MGFTVKAMLGFVNPLSHLTLELTVQVLSELLLRDSKR